MNTLQIRALKNSDFQEVDRIQHTSYSADLVEDIEILRQKFLLSPQICLIAEYEQNAVAYILAYPINREFLPPLNQVYAQKDGLNALFIHDLSVDNGFQKHGIGSKIYFEWEDLVKKMTYSEIYLISVQNSHFFWQKQGFQIIEHQGLLGLNYGILAKVMMKIL